MALRLSKALGRSPESWLTMQDNYDLWQARQTVDLKKVSKIEFKYACPSIRAGHHLVGVLSARFIRTAEPAIARTPDRTRPATWDLLKQSPLFLPAILSSHMRAYFKVGKIRTTSYVIYHK